MDDVLWFVAHTRPRCEKKLAEYCSREGISTTLPTYRSVRKYRGKKVVFEKPLFPGYLFIQMPRLARQKVFQSKHVANLLDVVDQNMFLEQLGHILRALDTDLEITVAPDIGEGKKVLIKSGPL